MEPIIAFCHIEKTAGTTLTELLRAHFGLRHADVLRHAVLVRDGSETPYFYDAEDLRRDLRLYPWVRSIAGHHIRPCTDFEEFESRIHWYSFLRDPVARLSSHYLHEVAIGNRTESLPDYLRKFTRDDIMVRKLAGERNLAAAKEIIETRLRFVGIQERFDRSLVLMREALGLADFSLAYGRPRNTSTRRVGGFIYELRRLARQRYQVPDESVQARARSQLDQHHGLLVEANSLDQQLYDYACNEIWARQVDQYGGVEKLARDTRIEMSRSTIPTRRRFFSFIYRNLVYKPYITVEIRRNRLLGVDKSKNKKKTELCTPTRP